MNKAVNRSGQEAQGPPVAGSRLGVLGYGKHALEMAIFSQSSDQLGRDSAMLASSALFTVGLGILAMRRGLAEPR